MPSRAEPVRLGTAVYLLTGLVREQPLWEHAPEAAAEVIARYREVVRAAAGDATGSWADGDNGVLVEFATAPQAAAGAMAILRDIAREAWPEGLAVAVRIGMCAARAATFRAPGMAAASPAAVRRCARLREVAHPGQIVLSEDTAALVGAAPPPGTRLISLGVRRLRDLSAPEPIVELDTGAGGFPPPLTLDVLPNNLPAQVTSLVGRDEELARLRRLLGERRLVTLAGPGGCGKTRLAAQAAAAAADRWPDGVWWVDLGSTFDANRVAWVAAGVLRVLIGPQAEPLRALAAQLERKRMLVCLDTCEHLLDAAAELADTLLRTCPQVSIMATSREPLGVAGETIYRVPPLDAEQSITLFSERATLVKPEFTLATTGAAAARASVDVICRRLDGMPLAIELASAWIRVLSPEQIADRLDNRFRLLTGGPRRAVGRHQALQACIEWSHNLLDDRDRVVFRRLGVFSGGFTLEAAKAVCRPADADDALDAIRRLVDKSLVVVDERTAPARYRLLDSIGQYARDRLEAHREMDAARQAHLDYFVTFAEAAEPELERDQDAWRPLLEDEHANLRAALRWGLAADDPTEGRRLAAALSRFWFLHGHAREGQDFLNRAIELAPDDRSRLQARLLCGAAMIAMGAGPPAGAARAAARALPVATHAGDDRSRARCLAIQSYGLVYNDLAASAELADRAQRYGESCDDPVAVDLGLTMKACALALLDRHDEAGPVARRTYQHALPRGERFSAAFALIALMNTALFTGDMPRAEELAAEAVRLAEPLGDYFAVGHTIGNLAWIRSLTGDLDAGQKIMAPIARSLEAAGPDIQISMLELPMGRLHLAGGDFEGAAKWFEQGIRFADPTTDNWVVASALPGLARALGRLGRRAEAQAYADRGVELARTLGVPNLLAQSLAEQAYLIGAAEPGRAEELHHQALAQRRERGLRTVYVDSLEALTALAARRGALAEAARLLAASQAAREQMGYPRPAIDQAEHEALLTVLRDGLTAEDLATAWREGAALSLDDAVAYATRARGRRSRPSTGWESLTPTEIAVVDHVVSGLTNPQIATRMFVSRATVKTHLSHIYTKLGVNNRLELARLAATRPPPGRQGLPAWEVARRHGHRP